MIPMAAVLETSAFVDSIGGDTFLVNSLDPVIVGEPLGKSQIVKYTCVAASERYIALGANSGGVYCFHSNPLEYVRLLTNKEGQVRLLSFSPDSSTLAVVCGNNMIAFWELNLQIQGISKRYYTSSILSGGTVQDVCWDPKGGRMVAGDDQGRVALLYLPKLSRKIDPFKRTDEIMYQDQGPVIQVDIHSDLILVSLWTRCVLLKTTSKGIEVVQVGKKAREGSFGSCFFVPHKGAVKVYAARPGGRVWEAGLDGRVSATHKLKDLLTVPPSPLLGSAIVPDFAPTQDSYMASTSISQIIRLSPHYVAVWIRSTLFVFSLVERHLIGWYELGDEVNSLCCHANSIYAVTDSGQVYRMSYKGMRETLLLLADFQLDSQVVQLCAAYPSKVLLQFYNDQVVRQIISAAINKTASSKHNESTDLKNELSVVKEIVRSEDWLLGDRNVTITAQDVSEGSHNSQSHSKDKSVDLKVEPFTELEVKIISNSSNDRDTGSTSSAMVPSEVVQGILQDTRSPFHEASQGEVLSKNSLKEKEGTTEATESHVPNQDNLVADKQFFHDQSNTAELEVSLTEITTPLRSWSFKKEVKEGLMYQDFAAVKVSRSKPKQIKKTSQSPSQESSSVVEKNNSQTSASPPVQIFYSSPKDNEVPPETNQAKKSIFLLEDSQDPANGLEGQEQPLQKKEVLTSQQEKLVQEVTSSSGFSSLSQQSSTCSLAPSPLGSREIPTTTSQGDSKSFLQSQEVVEEKQEVTVVNFSRKRNPSDAPSVPLPDACPQGFNEPGPVTTLKQGKSALFSKMKSLAEKGKDRFTSIELGSKMEAKLERPVTKMKEILSSLSTPTAPITENSLSNVEDFTSQDALSRIAALVGYGVEEVDSGSSQKKEDKEMLRDVTTILRKSSDTLLADSDVESLKPLLNRWMEILLKGYTHSCHHSKGIKSVDGWTGEASIISDTPIKAGKDPEADTAVGSPLPLVSPSEVDSSDIVLDASNGIHKNGYQGDGGSSQPINVADTAEAHLPPPDQIQNERQSSDGFVDKDLLNGEDVDGPFKLRRQRKKIPDWQFNGAAMHRWVTSAFKERRDLLKYVRELLVLFAQVSDFEDQHNPFVRFHQEVSSDITPDLSDFVQLFVLLIDIPILIFHLGNESLEMRRKCWNFMSTLRLGDLDSSQNSIENDAISSAESQSDIFPACLQRLFQKDPKCAMSVCGRCSAMLLPWIPLVLCFEKIPFQDYFEMQMSIETCRLLSFYLESVWNEDKDALLESLKEDSNTFLCFLHARVVLLSNKEHTKVTSEIVQLNSWSDDAILKELSLLAVTTPLSCHPAVLHLYRSHGYHKGYIQVLSGLLKNQTDLSPEIYIPQSDPSSAPLEMVMYTEAVGVICSIGNLTLLDEYDLNPVTMEQGRQLLHVACDHFGKRLSNKDHFSQEVPPGPLKCPAADILRRLIRVFGASATQQLLSELSDTGHCCSWLSGGCVLSGLVRLCVLEKQMSNVGTNILSQINTYLWSVRDTNLAPHMSQMELKGGVADDESHHKSTGIPPMEHSLCLEDSLTHWGTKISSVDRVCAICQVALYEQVSTSIPGIVALQCGHVYHRNCLSETSCLICFSNKRRQSFL